MSTPFSISGAPIGPGARYDPDGQLRDEADLATSKIRLRVRKQPEPEPEPTKGKK
jgi:hypothetical protein